MALDKKQLQGQTNWLYSQLKKLDKQVSLIIDGGVDITLPPEESALLYPVENTYIDNTEMFANQGEQTEQYFQYVVGTDTYYEKLATSTGAISDYRELSPEEVIIIIGRIRKPVAKNYADTTTMYSAAEQRRQITGYLYRIDADNTYYEFLGTRNGNATDYVALTPGLQAVLAAGNTATSADTNSFAKIDIQDAGLGLVDFYKDNGANTWADITLSFNQVYLGSQGVSGIYSDITLTNGVILLSQSEATGAIYTNVDFTTPTANTTLKFPAKSAGTYTLATTADIVAPSLQTVTDAGSTTSNDMTITSTANKTFTVENTTASFGTYLYAATTSGYMGTYGTGTYVDLGSTSTFSGLYAYHDTSKASAEILANSTEPLIRMGIGTGTNSFLELKGTFTAAGTYVATFQEASGTVAYLSDISAPVLEWATSTGTRAGSNLTLGLGDYDSSGNGNRIYIDDATGTNGLVSVNGTTISSIGAVTGLTTFTQTTGALTATVDIPNPIGISSQVTFPTVNTVGQKFVPIAVDSNFANSFGLITIVNNVASVFAAGASINLSSSHIGQFKFTRNQNGARTFVLPSTGFSAGNRIGIDNSSAGGGGTITLDTSAVSYVGPGTIQTDELFELIFANSTWYGYVLNSDSIVVKNDVTTSYNFVLADANEIVTLNNASPVSAIIPANASVPYKIGTKLTIFNKGAGTVTVSVTTDTINTELGGLTIPQYGKRIATKLTATEWILSY